MSGQAKGSDSCGFIILPQFSDHVIMLSAYLQFQSKYITLLSGGLCCILCTIVKPTWKRNVYGKSKSLIQSRDWSEAGRKMMDLNEKTRECRNSDVGGNFTLEEVTADRDGREMKNDTITHSSLSVCMCSTAKGNVPGP